MQYFSQITEQMHARPARRRMAVVCPDDEATLQALRRAEAEGLISPILINEPTMQASAERAVEMVQQGEADIIMKGLIHSDVLLRAILRHQGGLLPSGSLLTHVAVAEIPGYHKLLSYTDAAVLPFPTHEQRIAQVAHITRLLRALGIERPKVSLIHCSEEPNGRHFPYTEGYRDIVAMAREGRFGPCVVDGPLDLKTSCDAASTATKGISSEVAGDADALIFPNIEAGNVFHKTVTLWGGARLASLLMGPQVPVVLTSRADSAESKYSSILIAATAAASSL